ncbi:NADPH:quinone reductase-like Zn-dependent oxidoreductase [Paenibacillus sp. BK033]|uniref:NAD(P)-dependent alcohol dehydrogenase n=1 Tax=Paenibacillus sp. BK033 TaxID=2512133 RepID=UPI0010490E3F|nr:NAD(P)-dependent alcohol dehydrogenase [Paenibacillus sp. BK033]TCM95701.1 NADPH:quinone reductase-like Zn-dependent oxidoreductase [Paenibacillus sp. BK033]
MKSITMKALVYEAYGSPEVLRIKEVEVPAPKEHEVLIEVHAASVNSWDWDLLRGKPYITRIGGFRKPRYPILGADIAGKIIAVGASATRFRPGDKVFGDLSGCNWGGFAEYVCAREDALTPMPKRLSFEQAAAIPQAAVLALQGMRDKGNLQKGQHVLINGAGGGVGTFAIQYAKLHEAEVTAVDRASKRDMLLSLGADHMLDYEKEDFTATGRQYDLILDVVGTRSVFKVKRALKKGGTYVMIGGLMPRLLQTLLAAPLIRRLEKKNMTILVHKPNQADQQVWLSLAEAGRIAPVIDRLYGLQDAAEALRYFGEGEFKGKIVVRMKSENPKP